MNLKKLAPWNWFNKENDRGGNAVPVNRRHSIEKNSILTPSPNVFSDIDRLFDTAFNGFGRSLFGKRSNLLEGMSSSLLKPRLDLEATEKKYTICVEIPGVDEKDIQLQIANDTLTIFGEKKQKAEEKNKHYYRVERSYGSFQRVLSLPQDADQDKISARFKKGVLTVAIPRKALTGSNAKQIQINYA
jgi:HSP20 family protein